MLHSVFIYVTANYISLILYWSYLWNSMHFFLGKLK